ncbi:MAG: SUF system NifU family Fe-S cluster assembly protein [Sandaracinaceae bacterium]|nr:SUF system NifU family Fe-S cluster assembly protein [Sandaracinaceae bacterium]
MNELRELYQEYVLDHGKNPRNFRAIEHPTHVGEGYNPLCGDRITLQLVLDGDDIRDMAFQGAGCAISTASASTMTEALIGRSVTEARAMLEEFLQMVKGEGEPDLDALDKLAVFSGVSEFPMRVKCATLAWHTLTAALEGREAVTTE